MPRRRRPVRLASPPRPLRRSHLGTYVVRQKPRSGAAWQWGLVLACAAGVFEILRRRK